MRVLVAGSAGQLGRALAAAIPSDAELVAPPERSFDITDEICVRDVVGDAHCDVLVNAAAYTAVDRAETDEDAARRINVDGAALLAAHARAAGMGFIHISTDFVFDGTAGKPYEPRSATNPINAYGRTKLAGELAVCEVHPESLILRTAWVYAAFGNNFVRTMLRLMRERDSVSVVCDQIGTPTHAKSLARAVWTLARKRGTGILNWTDAGVASWYDFAVAIRDESMALGTLRKEVSILPIRAIDYPTPAHRPYYSVLDKTDGWALTGPARHWRAELRDCLKGIDS